MKHQTPNHLDAYYAEAATWAGDRERQVRTSRRLGWIVAAAATTVAVCEAIALAALTPLKTVVPYTLLVDRQTGHVEALDPLRPGRVTPDTALTRSFLAQYVGARESFSAEGLQENYRKTVLWSDGPVRNAYVAAMQPANPLSPLKTFPRQAIVQTQIKSIVPVDHDTAMLRFDTLRQDPGDAQPRRLGSWVALVTYRYSDKPMAMADRLINPLGFRVTGYVRDAEIAPGPEIAARADLPAPVPPASEAAP